MTLDEIYRNIVPRPNGCHEWIRSKQPKGYGTVWHQGKVWLAHRVVWTDKFGAIPDGLFICHHCDNPPCCNLDHLFMGSHRDNTDDMIAKKRGRGGIFRGSEVGDSKLTESQVLAIRADPRFLRQIAADFGVRESQISRIKNRVRWGWL